MISKTIVFNAGAIAADKPYKMSKGYYEASSWNQAEWEQRQVLATQKMEAARQKAQEDGMVIGAKVLLIDGNDFTQGEIVDFVDSVTLAYDFISAYKTEEPKILCVKFEGKGPSKRLCASDVVLASDELAGLSVIEGC